MSDDIKIVISQKGTIPVYTSTKVGGDSIVQHDETLSGAGTLTDPLKISQEILDLIGHGTSGYIFDFDASGTVWVIYHNLNKRPSVVVVDSTMTVVETTVEYIDNNAVQITLNSPFKGQAYLN